MGSIGRTPTADSDAIAACPSLELIADVIADHFYTRATKSHPMALAALTALRWAWGSERIADTELRTGSTWESMRASAARVGRRLPVDPPTSDQLSHLYRTKGEELAPALVEAFPEIGLDHARQLGLLLPDVTPTWTPPLRANAINGDGSVFGQLSDVEWIDGELVGSRASDPSRARVSASYIGKPREPGQEDQRPSGLPVVVVGAHSGIEHQRAILAIQPYQDGNETGAAMNAFRSVIGLAGGGVHTVHYDRLLENANIHRLAKMGVLTVSEMKAAPEGSGLAVDPNSERYRRGKHKDRVAKPRLRTTDFGGVRHQVPHVGGTTKSCVHRLVAVDGDLRIGWFGTREVTLDRERVALIEVKREFESGRCRMLATYHAPCPQGDFKFTIDVAQDKETPATDMGALEQMTAGQLRVISEAGTYFWEISGRRSEAESVFATLKQAYRIQGRASRLLLDHFVIDLIGAAVWINASAWDIHIAQHTVCGRLKFDELVRRRTL